MEPTAGRVLKKMNYNYKTLISKDFGTVYHLPEKQILICELNKSYVPIEEFKEIFSETVPLIKKLSIKKFIFDKQNLRVFHQPSMEWYFVEWKQEIYKLGMSVHRKILPKNQPAFKLAVEAGHEEIAKKYTDTIIPKLDIKYKESIEKAIEE